ncbi:MAG: asparagine synthase-related protein, partial [Chitinophagaceae bacterium]
SWLTNELKDVADTYLCESSLQKHNLFNKKIVDQLWSDLKNDKLDNYLKIWHLLSFQMWYEKWMK